MAQILLTLITIIVQTIVILPAIQPLGSNSEAKAKSQLAKWTIMEIKWQRPSTVPLGLY